MRVARFVLMVMVAAAAADASAQAPGQKRPLAPAFIDAHVHMDQDHPEASIALLLQATRGLEGVRAVIQTEPYGADDPARWDIEKVLAAVKRHSGGVALMGGGGTLNPMLLQAYATGDAGPAARARLRARAEEILREGAIGFGELSNEHFSTAAGPVKDYEYFPADSPLMLLLADIAAEHGAPIVLHMEAVPEDMPSGLAPPNPPALHANFQALENLLSHNPKTRLIWAHAGADNTGFRTPERMRPLLAAHPNLYMEIKYDPRAPGRNPPIVNGVLQPGWLRLFLDFPDRFIVGSDQHYDPGSTAGLARARGDAQILALLPAPLRQKIAVDNPRRIYRLPS
jgi:hypothetical protein